MHRWVCAVYVRNDIVQYVLSTMCPCSFSRKLMWLEVSPTNKDPTVIAGYYLNAVKGLPRLIRCDRGTENVKVAFLQPFLRRHGLDALSGIKSFQYGCSVTNQVQ